MMTNTDRLRIAAYSSLKKNLANVMCYVRKDSSIKLPAIRTYVVEN